MGIRCQKKKKNLNTQRASNLKFILLAIPITIYVFHNFITDSVRKLPDLIVVLDLIFMIILGIVDLEIIKRRRK